MFLNQCTEEDLDNRARRAEHHMNLALEARRGNLAQRYRFERPPPRPETRLAVLRPGRE